MVKVRLEEDSICYRIPDLQCLPLLLDLIEGCVHREDMDVIVWVGYPINGPGLAVDKLRVDYVRARAIFLLIAFANLGFHPGLDLRHGLVECFTDQFFDDLVAVYSQVQRDRLWHAKRKIVPSTAIRNLCCNWLTGLSIQNGNAGFLVSKLLFSCRIFPDVVFAVLLVPRVRIPASPVGR
jgi:hypothetical protein